MHCEKTFIDGLLILTAQLFQDERGYFFESYNKQKARNIGIDCEFVQDNESYSRYGTLRGLHFQTGEFAQAKLVRVVKGRVLDVAVDLRLNSVTFGKYIAVELSAENNKQLFIPKGFAHGFIVLSDEAILHYKCDNFYKKEAEDGLNYEDPELAIDWQIPKEALIVNQRDQQFQTLSEFRKKYLHAQ